MTGLETRRGKRSLVEDDEPEPELSPPAQPEPFKTYTIREALRALASRIHRPKIPQSWNQEFSEWGREVWTGKRRSKTNARVPAGFLGTPIRGIGILSTGSVSIVPSKKRSQPLKKLVDGRIKKSKERFRKIVQS